MIVHKPKFKKGDKVYVETYRSKFGTLPERDTVYTIGEIVYAHPMHGWSTYSAQGFRIADFNENILTAEEFSALCERKHVSVI